MDGIRNFQNHLLGSMQEADRLLLEPHMSFVDLPLKMPLESPNTPIESCFFPSEGIASVVATGRNGKSIEVGLSIREGVTGSIAILGSTQSPDAIFMQVAGNGHQISIRHLKEAIRKSPGLSETLTKFIYSFMVQTSQTALVNGRATIDERLARWLLMAHDRVSAPNLHITHEFLSLMLGVRRPSVTDALHLLEGRGLIRSSRNEVVVRDRSGLEAAADWCYGVPQAEYNRVCGFDASTGTVSALSMLDDKLGG